MAKVNTVVRGKLIIIPGKEGIYVVEGVNNVPGGDLVEARKLTSRTGYNARGARVEILLGKTPAGQEARCATFAEIETCGSMQIPETVEEPPEPPKPVDPPVVTPEPTSEPTSDPEAPEEPPVEEDEEQE